MQNVLQTNTFVPLENKRYITNHTLVSEYLNIIILSTIYERRVFLSICSWGNFFYGKQQRAASG